MEMETGGGRTRTRVAIVAAGLIAMTLSAVAAEAIPKLDATVQAFVDHLGARPIDCPSALLPSEIEDRTYCGAVELSLKQLRKSISKFVRQHQGTQVTQFDRWSELNGGLRTTPLLLGSLLLQLVFDPPNATLLLVPHEGCLEDSDATSPGLFERDTAGIEPPERLRLAAPQYPGTAQAMRIDGVVVLQAIIKKNGTTDEHCVLYVQPDDYGFAESAIRALRQARYKPATRDGEPVEIVVTIANTFEIR